MHRIAGAFTSVSSVSGTVQIYAGKRGARMPQRDDQLGGHEAVAMMVATTCRVVGVLSLALLLIACGSSKAARLD